jgi:hypothetical protein
MARLRAQGRRTSIEETPLFLGVTRTCAREMFESALAWKRGSADRERSARVVLFCNNVHVRIVKEHEQKKGGFIQRPICA